MALFPNGVRVRGPRPTEPRRYGLLDVAPPTRPDDLHWMVGGVNWEDVLCTQAESFLDVCPPATGFTKPAERDMNFCHSDPFQVVGSFNCSVGGRVRQYEAGEAFEIARQRLLQWEGYEVEQAFWTGLTANGEVNPSLAVGNEFCDIAPIDLTPGGGAVEPTAGIATLEDALAELVPNSGIIHVPFGLAAYLSNLRLMYQDGERMISPSGNTYVLGAGYTGSGPLNVPAAAGTTWIYATGPVATWESELYYTPNDLKESINRQINDVTVRAEKYFAVGFSCTVLAINVTLSCACG